MRLHTTPESIWAHVQKSDRCWIGIGDLHRQGYVRVWYQKRRWLLHRLIWTFERGPIPDGMDVLHNCPDGDNPRCCNPDHLFLGTHSDNMRDARRKGSAGYQRVHGSYMSNAKLTEDVVHAIRQQRAEGAFLTTLARRYGVAYSLIQRICARRAWTHIP